MKPGACLPLWSCLSLQPPLPPPPSAAASPKPTLFYGQPCGSYMRRPVLPARFATQKTPQHNVEYRSDKFGLDSLIAQSSWSRRRSQTEEPAACREGLRWTPRDQELIFRKAHGRCDLLYPRVKHNRSFYLINMKTLGLYRRHRMRTIEARLDDM